MHPQAGIELGASLASWRAREAKRNADAAASGASRPGAAGREFALRPKSRPPVSRVLLVGGATRAPAFRSFVTNLTGLTPDAGAVDPDQAVALGAATQAASLDGDPALAGTLVLDVWQAGLARALATAMLRRDDDLAARVLGEGGLGEEEGGSDDDDAF